MKAIFTPQSRQVLAPENKISWPAPLDQLSTIITSIRLHPSARTSTRREFVYPLRSYKPNWQRLPLLFWPTLEPPDQNDKIIAYSKHHEVEIIYWRSSPQTRVLFTSSFSICSLAFGYYTEVIMFIWSWNLQSVLCLNGTKTSWRFCSDKVVCRCSKQGAEIMKTVHLYSLSLIIWWLTLNMLRSDNRELR